MHVELVKKRWVYANKECTLNTAITVSCESRSALQLKVDAFTESHVLFSQLQLELTTCNIYSTRYQNFNSTAILLNAVELQRVGRV